MQTDAGRPAERSEGNRPTATGDRSYLSVFRGRGRAGSSLVFEQSPISRLSRSPTKGRPSSHQQGRDMFLDDSISVCVGIDVPKDFFDVHVLPENHSQPCPQTPEGRQQLLALLPAPGPAALSSKPPISSYGPSRHPHARSRPYLWRQWNPVGRIYPRSICNGWWAC